MRGEGRPEGAGDDEERAKGDVALLNHLCRGPTVFSLPAAIVRLQASTQMKISSLPNLFELRPLAPCGGERVARLGELG